jgi:hypothetical protein
MLEILGESVADDAGLLHRCKKQKVTVFVVAKFFGSVVIQVGRTRYVKDIMVQMKAKVTSNTVYFEAPGVTRLELATEPGAAQNKVSINAWQRLSARQQGQQLQCQA